MASVEEIARWLVHNPLLSLTGQGLEESKQVRAEVQKLIAQQACNVIRTIGGDLILARSEVYARCAPTEVYVSSRFPIGPIMERWERSYGVEIISKNSAADIALKVRTELGTRVHRLMAQSGRFDNPFTY